MGEGMQCLVGRCCFLVLLLSLATGLLDKNGKNGENASQIKEAGTTSKSGRNTNLKNYATNAQPCKQNEYNITCLNDMIEVLKIDKDTVQNFIQQKRRLDARLLLAEKKRNKSDAFETTRDYLVSSLGG